MLAPWKKSYDQPSSVQFNRKQKTAYEMCVGDWSSDVCSSDLPSAVILEPKNIKSDTVSTVSPSISISMLVLNHTQMCLEKEMATNSNILAWEIP